MCDRFINSFVENVIEKLKQSLKLYHVSLPNGFNLGYDSYSDFVVAAYSEEEARNTYPGGGSFEDRYGEWISKNKVGELIVTEIGNASEFVKPGIIVESYHAG